MKSGFQRRFEVVCQDGVSVDSYSGRFMYGKRCLSINGSLSDCMRAIADNIALAQREGTEDDILSYMQNILVYKSDNLGRDVVLYWPKVEYVEDDHNED